LKTEDPILTEKKCSKCGEVKPIEGFYKLSTSKNNYRSRCKECTEEDKKKYRLNNSDKIKESYKNYCLNNSDKVKKVWKLYRLNNPEKIKNNGYISSSEVMKHIYKNLPRFSEKAKYF
jgi:hypothetical protein